MSKQDDEVYVKEDYLCLFFDRHDLWELLTVFADTYYSYEHKPGQELIPDSKMMHAFLRYYKMSDIFREFTSDHKDLTDFDE